ncbi:MAG TPA: LemA family protein [Elusimicrobiota bacterium]|nr:LemA family protein [Elusimicrobiota bacterium]
MNNERGVVQFVAIGAAVILLGFLVWAVGTYNSLVVQNENVSRSWSTVESQYQRRLDLVPNLVETVKGSAKFEKETLTAVVDARARATSVNVDKSVLNDPAAFKKFEEAQAGLGSALSKLLVTVERYPDIKTTEAYRDLTVQLEGTENRIQVARKDFNEAAQEYNVSIKVFPASVIAGMGGFKERPYFTAAPAAAQAPAVKF